MAINARVCFFGIGLALVAGWSAWLLLGGSGIALLGGSMPSTKGSPGSGADAPGSYVASGSAIEVGLSRLNALQQDGVVVLKFRSAAGGMVPGVKVHLFHEAGGQVKGPVVSDQEGAAVFESLTGGAYRLLVAGPWLLVGDDASLRISLTEEVEERIVDVEEGYIARYRFVNDDVIFHRRQPLSGFREVLMSGVGAKVEGVTSACFRRVGSADFQDVVAVRVVADSANHGRCEFDVPLVPAGKDVGGCVICDFSGRPEAPAVDLVFDVVDASGQPVEGGILLSEQRDGESVPFGMAGGSVGKPMRVSAGRVFNGIEVGTFPITWSFVGRSVDTGGLADTVVRVHLELPCKLIPVDLLFRSRGESAGQISHIHVETSDELRQLKGVRAQGGMKMASPGESCRAWFPPGRTVLKVSRGGASWNEIVDVSHGMGEVIIEL